MSTYLTIKTRIALEEFELEVEYLSELLNYGSKRLIENNWNEESLKNFNKGIYSKSFFKEKQELLPIYLPNRAKRMMFELSANTLKSQHQAFNIFIRIKENCKSLDCSIKEFKGVSWSYVSILMRRIEKWNEKWWIGSVGIENLYKTRLSTDSFFEFQKIPDLSKIVLPYYQDDEKMIKLDYVQGKAKIKLPLFLARNKKEWSWREVNFTLHERIKEILRDYRVVNPTLVKKRRKSGSYYYELNIPYEVPFKEFKTKKPKRVLGVDLGIKKLAVLTIVDSTKTKKIVVNPLENYFGSLLEIEAYNHSKPFFIKNKVLGKLKNLREQQSRIQEYLSRIKKGESKKEFKHLHAHFRRIQRKFRALNTQIAHEVSKFLVLYALENNCDTIVFERLGYFSKGGNKDLNWIISGWIRGKIMDYTQYKAKLKGIRVVFVNPRSTSRICSKCGERGKTYKDSLCKQEIKSGSFFRCENCGFQGDRDYNATLNIARLCLSEKKNIKEVQKVVAYTDTTAGYIPFAQQVSEVVKCLERCSKKSWIIRIVPQRHFKYQIDP